MWASDQQCSRSKSKGGRNQKLTKHIKLRCPSASACLQNDDVILGKRVPGDQVHQAPRLVVQRFDLGM